ncbi:diguanylate cyclase [Sphingomonas sp. GC_Shp_1]|uniref:GGDEF domain-containing protein n=1 Tax=Sphingomonas sp. GC_Shp_1 TaxID=2937385 RepID=UPI00226BAC4B|nr:diguanylate cyclase [Sphingomonas sp. GC_Shp_1]
MPDAGWVRAIATIALVLLGFVVAPAAWARGGTPLATCIARVQPGDAARAMFASPARFDCRTPQTSFGGGDYWVLAPRLPQMASAGTSVRTGSVWQHRVTLYIRYADGAVRQTGFTSRTTGRHLRLGAIIQLPLPAHAAPPVQLLWHVERSLNLRGIVIGATLVDDADAARGEVVTAALYATFAGMCLALLIYNLALWAALRQRFQPAYCLMVLCLLAYTSTSSGLVGQLTGIDNNDRLRLNYLFLAMSAATALVFARAFFERRVFDGWLRPTSDAVIALLLGTAGAYALCAPRFAAIIDPLATSSYLALVLLVVPILWRAARQRSNYLWIFALAWGGPVILAIFRIAAAFNLIHWNFWIDNSTLGSMAMEAVLSSLGVAYRIRLLSLERDDWRQQESAARTLADTDPLTGLLNRRAFLDRAIGREGEQMLLIADIDHFKAINETIGHDGGDEVLRTIARALRAAVPPDALVARIGGEEFAIVAPLPSGLKAAAVLERLRRERMPHDVAVTASIGACFGALLREADWQAMYRCADQALFEAKAKGRDRAHDVGALARAA